MCIFKMIKYFVILKVFIIYIYCMLLNNGCINYRYVWIIDIVEFNFDYFRDIIMEIRCIKFV